MNRLALARVVAAAAVLIWAVVDARSRRAALAPLPVAGLPIDAPAAPRVRRPDRTVIGAGTPESPAAVPFACFAFPDYDPAPLRLDRTPLDRDRFPPPLGKLDGRVVRVEGFPLILDAREGELTTFLLTRFPPGCCFGLLPVLDEWIEVSLAEPIDFAGVDASRTAAATGTLEVGERLAPDGRVLSLYRLTAARVRPGGP